MADNTTWLVTGNGQQALPKLAQALARAGAQEQSRLDALGILIVSGSAAQAEAWRRLPGVAAVEADAGVDIGPPGADPS